MIGNDIKPEPKPSKLKPFKNKKVILEHFPKCDNFGKISKDDLVVYYAKSAGLVIGVFQVVSKKMQFLPYDDFWNPCMYFNIKPYKMLPEQNFFNFKKFFNEKPLTSLEVTNLDDSSVVVGNFFRKLDEKDYSRFEQALFDPQYRTTFDEPRGHVGTMGYIADSELLSGLLDYYNSRAASFASLFVASVFGIITLSAIIQVAFSKFVYSSFIDIIQVAISIILYLSISTGAYYTLKCYSYYTSLADTVKNAGLQSPNFYVLNKIMTPSTENGKTTSVGLIQTITKVDKTHCKTPIKRIMKDNQNIKLIFVFSLLLLATFIYWDIISQILSKLLIG